MASEDNEHTNSQNGDSTRSIPTWRRCLYGFLASVLLLVIIILLLEATLVMFSFEYIPMRIKLLNKTDWRVDHAFQNNNFVYDSTLIWRPRPGQSVFNEQGMRGPLFSNEKQPGEFRILAIGDSNTLGWDGTNGPNWPLYLGALLHEVNTNIVLVNAGVWGYSSFQGLQRFKQALIFQPDLVLWSFGANDAHLVGAPDRFFASAGVRQLRIDRFLMRRRTGQLALKIFDSLPALFKSATPSPRVPQDEFKAYMKEVIHTCHDLGIGILLLTRPFVGRSPSETWWKARAPEYNQITREAALTEGAQLADVYAWFKDQREMFSDESHFTETGHRRAAALLFEIMSKYWPNLFPQP